MMSTREFYFPSGGIRLHCKLDLPGDEAGSRFPLVLVIPGLTGHMEEPHITAIADALPLSGYACLRAELYGHGMSGGSFHDHNLFLWALEIMDLIDYVRKMDSVSEIYLCGHSQGLILLAPAMLMKENAMTGGFPEKFFDPERIPDETLVFDEQPISGNYYRVNRLLPFDDAIRLYGNRPVLVVHSKTDELVPFRYGEETAAAYQNAELVSIEADDHCFETHIDLVTGAMVRFLDKIRG